MQIDRRTFLTSLVVMPAIKGAAMGDSNSTIHSYCDGFNIVMNGPDDYSLRMVKEGGASSMKVIRRTGLTAYADLLEMMNLLNAALRLQGADV